MHEIFTLAALPPGSVGCVAGIDPHTSMANRLADLGLIPGTKVTCLARSPFGDPTAYLIRGAVIALRRGDAAAVRLGTDTP